MSIRWKAYSSANAYDELITPHGRARRAAQAAARYIGSLTDAELRGRRDAAELAMRVMARSTKSVLASALEREPITMPYVHFDSKHTVYKIVETQIATKLLVE